MVAKLIDLRVKEVVGNSTFYEATYTDRVSTYVEGTYRPWENPGWTGQKFVSAGNLDPASDLYIEETESGYAAAFLDSDGTAYYSRNITGGGVAGGGIGYFSNDILSTPAGTLGLSDDFQGFIGGTVWDPVTGWYKLAKFVDGVTAWNWSEKIDQVTPEMTTPAASPVDAARQMFGTQEFDTITGGAGNDTIEGYRRGDVIDGGAGNDEIRAGKGHDTVLGGEGNDTIYTGMGDDLITTGAGADTIMLSSRDLGFDYAAGNKIVTDFSVAEDRLGFDGVDAITWARLNSGEAGFGISSNADGDAVISWVSDHGFGGTVTLQGVTVGQVTADLFV